MSKNLADQLKQLRATERRIQPDREWVKSTREILLMQVRNTMPPAKRQPLAGRIVSMIKFAVPRQAVAWITRPAMALVSLLALALGGSIMSVSAAEKSLPGDMLYGLKLATEQARIILTPSKEERLKLKTEFTTRRIQELKVVAKTPDKTQKKERVSQVTEILKSDMTTLKEQLSDVSKEVAPDKAVEAAKLVDQKSNEIISVLQETKSDVPDSKGEITEAQSAAADTGVKAIEVLAEKHQEDNSVVPVKDVTQAIQDHARVVADATVSSTEQGLATATSSSDVPVSGTSTAAVLNELKSASTTASGNSSTLPSLVDQVKDATTQAFVLQKTADTLEAASSTAAADASSTNNGEKAVTPTTTSPTSGGNAATTTERSASTTDKN